MDKENNLKRLSDKLKQDKKLALIVVLAIVGSLLLILSEIIPSRRSEEEKKVILGENDVYLTEYRTALEDNLERMISKIAGAGECCVMITLECSVERVYAQNISSGSDYFEGKNNQNGTSEHVIIKSGTGIEGGLLISVIEPRVRGVAVVCEGGDSYIIKTAITDTVTALFSIGGNKVSVAKMKPLGEE
ncbi:MAG: hypothetical protein BWY46_00040 [Firmicutes bacterium ADurb.Bin300]|nr:MAG: hypothetical protein BWY46_00040 [Firmicutes bacterium ADurb.Bin300]